MASPNEVLSTIHTLLVLKLNHILCHGAEWAGFHGFNFIFLARLSLSNPHAVAFASGSHCKYDLK